MLKRWDCKSLDGLPRVAHQILEQCKSGKIAFFGEMGSGKTTLIQEICKQLGIDETVDSPTFTILNEYHGKVKINHFDFYRLKSKDELYELGFEEYFYSNDYVLIEWPEKIGDMLPDFFQQIRIELENDGSRSYTYNMDVE